MFRVALTGGIATGKSHVAKRLSEAGVPVVDADVLAREAVASGSPGLQAVAQRFGVGVIRADGTLDRARLGAVVFADAAARHDLEAIVHPAVRRAIEDFFSRLPASVPFAVADIPLLYETTREHAFDKVIVVACDRESQLSRVMTRDGLSRDDAERRIRSQLPLEDKIARADYVIDTGGTHAETDEQVTRLLDRLRRDLSR
jgi:dephospho-CoA kinase